MQSLSRAFQITSIDHLKRSAISVALPFHPVHGEEQDEFASPTLMKSLFQMRLGKREMYLKWKGNAIYTIHVS